MDNLQYQPVPGAEPVDYRTQLTFEKVPLQRGWNHFIIKVASNSLRHADPGVVRGLRALAVEASGLADLIESGAVEQIERVMRETRAWRADS